MNTLIKGEDKTLTLQLEDSAGNPLLFADLLDIKIALTVNAVEVLKFAKVTATGYQPIVAGVATNEAKILIKGADTATMPTGLMRMEVQLTISDADYTSGRKDFQQAQIFMVKDSLL